VTNSPRAAAVATVATRVISVFGSVIGLFALAACSDDSPDPSNLNPPKLWLALDGSETQVKLIDVEPRPF
jgi:hypothetical protein